MRATSPLDEIEFLGDPVELPRPKYAVGTRLDVAKVRASEINDDYYWRTAVRAILRDTQKLVYSLKRDGFMHGMVGQKMLEHNKTQIRRKLDMMRYADSIELAGAAPESVHVSNVANQCYLADGQCHGGVKFRYYLLFRRTVDGAKWAYLHPYPVIAECYVAAGLLLDTQNAATPKRT